MRHQRGEFLLLGSTGSGSEIVVVPCGLARRHPVRRGAALDLQRVDVSVRHRVARDPMPQSGSVAIVRRESGHVSGAQQFILARPPEIAVALVGYIFKIVGRDSWLFRGRPRGEHCCCVEVEQVQVIAAVSRVDSDIAVWRVPCIGKIRVAIRRGQAKHPAAHVIMHGAVQPGGIGQAHQRAVHVVAQECHVPKRIGHAGDVVRVIHVVILKTQRAAVRGDHAVEMQPHGGVVHAALGVFQLILEPLRRDAFREKIVSVTRRPPGVLIGPKRIYILRPVPVRQLVIQLARRVILYLQQTVVVVAPSRTARKIKRPVPAATVIEGHILRGRICVHAGEPRAVPAMPQTRRVIRLRLGPAALLMRQAERQSRTPRRLIRQRLILEPHVDIRLAHPPHRHAAAPAASRGSAQNGSLPSAAPVAGSFELFPGAVPQLVSE